MTKEETSQKSFKETCSCDECHAYRSGMVNDLKEQLAQAQAETERLRRSAEGWEEEAKRFCQNADFWREKFEAVSPPPEPPCTKCDGTKLLCIGIDSLGGEVTVPCDGCRDAQGQPTGYRFNELRSGECTCGCHIDVNLSKWKGATPLPYPHIFNCHDHSCSGVTLPPDGELVGVLMEIASTLGAEVMVGYSTQKKGWYCALEWVDWDNTTVLDLQESDYCGDLVAALTDAVFQAAGLGA